MLHAVTIEHFRGFGRLELPRLTRFTVVAGQNNVGKSSVLEAIFLLAGMRIPDMPERVSANRAMRPDSVQTLHALFHDQDIATPVTITGRFDGQMERRYILRAQVPKEGAFRRYEIPGADSTQATTNIEAFPALEQVYAFGRAGQAPTEQGALSTLVDKDGTIRALSGTNSRETWRCAYLGSHEDGGGKDLAKLIKDKQEEPLIEALRRIDGRVQGLALAKEEVLVDLGGPTRLPVPVLGDGMLHIIRLFVVANACRDGGLMCIDEIENGLHHSAMRVVWESLARFALEHDVQIVATTHNLEMLRQIATPVEDNGTENLTFIGLRRRRDGTVVAETLSGADTDAQLDLGVELR